MISLLSFDGKIRPLRYALWSVAAFFSQHLVILILLHAHALPTSWQFYVLPLRSLATIVRSSEPMLILALAYGLLVAWVLAALAFRRAADANVSEWIAAAAIVPVIQIPAILLLCVAPSRISGQPAPLAGDSNNENVRWVPAAQGMIAGIALTLFSVAVSALVFRVYGYGLFVVSPFIIGAVAAYFANRKNDVGAPTTARIALGATLLGGLSLVATALEGVLCIVMASPLAIPAALVGGLLGHSIARLGRRPARQTLSGFALLPMVFATEYAFPPTTTFETYQTIGIDAPPDAVWNAIIKMDTMNEPLALPFRLGVAYPLRGEILGEGVGATRRGEFSTGIAIERVTEWIPGQMLAFVVEKDVPAMDEISPYRHVHAPHAVGYFSTSRTIFELVRRPDGGTEVVERTSHQLNLDPVYYWLPTARWIVRENNARVLAHVRCQAEQSLR
jgi:uncharacterized membrane protein YhaH (DUF805 family)